MYREFSFHVKHIKEKEVTMSTKTDRDDSEHECDDQNHFEDYGSMFRRSEPLQTLQQWLRDRDAESPQKGWMHPNSQFHHELFLSICEGIKSSFYVAPRDTWPLLKARYLEVIERIAAKSKDVPVDRD
jgi:hypothetical protein